MERLLTCSDTPTAVFAYNDKIAVGARRALLAAGKSVPQDIALVGYDGDEFVAYLDFPLTTVSQPLYEVGRRAVEISSSRAAVGDLCLLKPELIVRASCGTGHNGAGIMAGFKGRSKKEQSA